jgi:hypothetical protein
MKVGFNTMLKNEARILPHILKIWEKYPIDIFIFYDDNSTDNSVELIYDILGKDRVIIINDNLPSFNESHNRQRMIDVSRENKVDIVLSIDCDELLTTTITSNFKNFLKIYEKHDMLLFWYNSVNNTIEAYRNDPQYANNYRSFVLPLNNTGSLNTNQFKYHTPRTPSVSLPKIRNNDFGVIHLQALNTKYYAIKQLWYKHHEFINYGHTVEFINNRYDPVVNGLNFNPKKIDKRLIDGIDFDAKIFDGLEVEKGYLKFIHDNYNADLITFGKEYL